MFEVFSKIFVVQNLPCVLYLIIFHLNLKRMKFHKMVKLVFFRSSGGNRLRHPNPRKRIFCRDRSKPKRQSSYLYLSVTCKHDFSYIVSERVCPSNHVSFSRIICQFATRYSFISCKYSDLCFTIRGDLIVTKRLAKCL